MENGGGAEHNVTATMHFTKEISKVPTGLNGPDHTEGHDHTAQQEISGGHGENQKVGWGVELLEMSNGNDHNHVAQHSHYNSTNHDHIHNAGSQQGPHMSRT